MRGVPLARAGAWLLLPALLAACGERPRTYRIGDRVQGGPPASLAIDARTIGWEDLRNTSLNKSLDGAEVKIVGFAVPLDFRKGAITEFLLVPSFGACIHVPPPPPNQIIHVIAARPVTLRSMSVVWVAGRLSASLMDTAGARSGYRMPSAEVAPQPAR